MLTSALNKSPKPPIIVDDIIVTELNLGQIPPELEILEIGDLAEDRFRGIFKMSYTGDAFLTLKTRVQANPLNTYLSTKPSFASPQPLAAASSLTIPLSITLSEFKLSGFVILVFSRSKGITLVFRNDPLEALKVSSTFDSIPFVRDYLQKEIEQQLRVLFMDDLPAIIHRLSLRMLSPEQEAREQEKEREEQENSNEPAIDPLASPPQDPYDAFGRPLDEADLSALSPEHDTEMHATFSQKNLLHLAALTDSHRTLSLFTPPMRDAVFRAWAGAAERGDGGGTRTPTFTLASLSRQQGSTLSANTSVYSASAEETRSRAESVSTLHSAYGGSQISMSTGITGKSRSHGPQRKRRNRVVNLRKSTGTESATSDDTASVDGSTASYGSRRSSLTPPSEVSYSGHQSREGELDTPPSSPEQVKKATPPHFRSERPGGKPQPPQHIQIQAPSSRRLQEIMVSDNEDNDRTPRARPNSLPAVAHHELSAPSDAPSPLPKLHSGRRAGLMALQPEPISEPAPASAAIPAPTPISTLTPLPSRASTSSPTKLAAPRPMRPEWLQRTSTGSILEQAWMVKMANEIAHKVHDEKAKVAVRRGFWDEHGHGHGHGHEHEHGEEGVGEAVCRQMPPPPAYAA